MITKDEIRSVANETGLTPAVVEKDYVLSWLLGAINANPALSEHWVFKGGTCLKKCYFETYRFSEDLDFTLTKAQHLNEDFLNAQFEEIADWLYERSGIELPKDRFVFDIYDNPRGGKACEARIYYVSYFVKGRKSLPKIKFDLTADEVLVLPPARKQVFHAYSDTPPDGFHITSYDYPEVFGEKVRALGERGRPRDLYDVINLFRNNHLPPAAVVADVLSQKCAFKNISTPTLDDMDGYREELAGNWEPMLGHQLPSLPSLDVYWQALPEFFRWLSTLSAPERPQLASVTALGEVYRPVYGQLGLHDLSGGSLEIIRFASGNRLCVELDYTDASGERKSRVIEPYSLRKSSDDNILLYAVRADDAQIRAYRIDRINSISLTDRVFDPRYQVELSPNIQANEIQPIAQTRTQLGIPRQNRSASGGRAFGSRTGPVYVYQCRYCDKIFKRKIQNSVLRSHKTKDGWPCSGRSGYLVDTVY